MSSKAGDVVSYWKVYRVLVAVTLEFESCLLLESSDSEKYTSNPFTSFFGISKMEIGIIAA